MDKRDTYKKAVTGPAGINCSCCRCGSKAYAKRLNNRGKRRLGKMVLWKEIG